MPAPTCSPYELLYSFAAILVMQAQGYDGRPVKYSGMIDVLQKAFRHEGIRGLYKVSGHALAA